ncbi:MAG TPA: response regulator [Spirochaetia bacterium]|nr:response regulator [Spirochaetia bacterium]
MKKILVIDESKLFRDFLTQKLEEFGFEVIAAVNGLDGAAKLRREMPDLLIMDYYLSRTSSLELLQKKKEDPNTAEIPVIMASGKIDRDKLVQVAHYNVRKFFTKPIRIDGLVKSISELLGVTLEIDSTPCIIEAHFNDDILFIEIAQGLNREKIELLRYKIAELMELYEVKSPKVLIIMSSIDVSADDSISLSVLFSTVMENTRAKPRQVKVLTNSEYVAEFIEDRTEYDGVEVTDNLERAMDGLLGRKAGSMIDRESKTVQHEFLQVSSPKSGKEESVDMKFEGERANFDLNELGEAVSVAIVDDDFVIREMVKAVLSDMGPTIREFENGKEYVSNPDRGDFDLVFLDLMMPEMDGFEVMERLQRDGNTVPIIVLSALSQRETVVKAMKYGVTSYLIKPLQPESILNKAREVLRTNF